MVRHSNMNFRIRWVIRLNQMKFSKSIETEAKRYVQIEFHQIQMSCIFFSGFSYCACYAAQANTHKIMNGSYFLCANKTPRYVVWFYYIFLCLLLLNCVMLAMLIVSTLPICSQIGFYGFYFYPIHTFGGVMWWFYHCAPHTITDTFSSSKRHLCLPLDMDTLRMISIDLCERCFCLGTMFNEIEYIRSIYRYQFSSFVIFQATINNGDPFIKLHDVYHRYWLQP